MNRDRTPPEGFWTVPNAISALRLAGIAPLLWAAYEGHRHIFLGILAVLLLSDWADGKLAVWLEQRTELGARLDSAVDAAMYAAVALSCWWLESEAVQRQVLWFVGVGTTWGVSGLVALVRFGRMPSYHTRSAKLSWLVVAVVAVGWIATGDDRGVPWALALVIATNLEAIAIGFALSEWRADVSSIAEVVRPR
ncbi:MAG: CDP-alcohol phosphatidyltransferase family protein [Gemmatimonadota bacterium]